MLTNVHNQCCFHCSFRVCIALYKLASCAEYSKVASVFGVSKSTVHRCLYMLCEAMAARKHEMIRWYTDEDAARLAYITQANYKYPQAIGMYTNLMNVLICLFDPN